MPYARPLGDATSMWHLQGSPIKARAGAQRSRWVEDPWILLHSGDSDIADQQTQRCDKQRALLGRTTPLPAVNITQSPTSPGPLAPSCATATLKPSRPVHQRPIPSRALASPTAVKAHPHRMRPEDPGYWYRPPVPREQASLSSPQPQHPAQMRPASVVENVRPSLAATSAPSAWAGRGSEERSASSSRTQGSRQTSPYSGNSTTETSLSSTLRERPASAPSWSSEQVPGLMSSTASASEASSEYTRPVSPRSAGSGPESSSTLNASPFPLKKRRTRVLMTRMQTMELNAVWLQHKFPITSDREALSRKIGLTPRQVQVWFQNQRQKYRRQMLQYAGPSDEQDSVSYEHYSQSFAEDDLPDGPEASGSSMVDRWRHENPSAEALGFDPRQSTPNHGCPSRPHTPYDRPSALQFGPGPHVESRPSLPPHSVHPLPDGLGPYKAEAGFLDGEASAGLSPAESSRRDQTEQRWATHRDQSQEQDRRSSQLAPQQPLPSRQSSSSGISGSRPAWVQIGHRPHTNPVPQLPPLHLADHNDTRAGLTLPSIRADFSPHSTGSFASLPPSPGLTHDTPDSTYHSLYSRPRSGIDDTPTTPSQRLPPVLSSLLIDGTAPQPPHAQTSSPPPGLEKKKGETRPELRGRLPSLKELFS